MTRIAFAAAFTIVLACGAETLDAGSAGQPLADAGGPVALADAGAPIGREQATRLCQSLNDATVALEVACEGDGRPLPSAMIEQCIASLLQPGVTTGTADQLDRCLTKHLSQTDCVVPFDCLNELRGSLPGGARCISNAQCANGVCVGSTVFAPACGTCGEPLAPGSTCDTAGAPCAAGYVCQVANDGCIFPPCSTTGTCAPEATAPSPNSCGADASCTESFGCDAGQCVPLAREGESCTENRDCLAALRCDATTHRCAKREALGPREDCNDPSWPEQKPCAGPMAVCPALDDGTQRCHVWIAEGQACDPNEKPGSLERCELGLRCVDSRCRLDWPTCP